MADRRYPLESLNVSGVVIEGYATLGGSGAVSSYTGQGFTFTKPAGTGLYRITLDKAYSALIGAQCSVYNGGTAADVKVQFASDYSVANKTMDIQYISGTGAANGTSGHKIYFSLKLKRV